MLIQGTLPLHATAADTFALHRPSDMARPPRRAPPPLGASGGATSRSSSQASSTPSLFRDPIPNRLNLTLILVLQPLFLLATCFLIASPLLSPSTEAESNELGLIQRYAARLARTRGDILVTAAWKALVAVFVVQGWWCTRIGRWCRAAASCSVATRAAPGPDNKVATKGNQAEQTTAAERAQDERIGKKDVEEVALSIFSLPLLIAFFDLVIILFGAPPSLLLEVTLLSSYLSLLVGLPAIHVLGVPFLSASPSPTSSTCSSSDVRASATQTDGSRWLRVVELDVSRHPLILPIVGPVVGVLATSLTLGTAALALDWEREWQKFPIPCIAAAVVGLIVGNGATVVRAWM